jgi:hypothetical protein
LARAIEAPIDARLVIVARQRAACRARRRGEEEKEEGIVCVS